MFQVGCSRDVSMTCSLHTRNSRLLFLILDSHISSFINFLSFFLLHSRPLCNLRTSLIRPFMHIWRHNNTILHISSITHSSKRLLRLSHPHSFGFSNASRFNGSLARASNGRATTTLRFRLRLISRCTHVVRFELRSSFFLALFRIVSVAYSHVIRDNVATYQARTLFVSWIWSRCENWQVKCDLMQKRWGWNVYYKYEQHVQLRPQQKTSWNAFLTISIHGKFFSILKREFPFVRRHHFDMPTFSSQLVFNFTDLHRTYIWLRCVFKIVY